jgi:hypothetical protein
MSSDSSTADRPERPHGCSSFRRAATVGDREQYARVRRGEDM